MKRPMPSALVLSMILAAVALPAHAADKLKPFVLAQSAGGDPAQTVEEVKSKLKQAGFDVVGSYSPYDGATILAITDDELKKNAAGSDFGGYGAAQRVSITRLKDEVQVAYTNPAYMAGAYRMKGDLKPVAARLEKALGRKAEFGPEQGLTPDELRKYHYMMGMEYFDEPSVLAEYPSHDAAVAKVEENLGKKVAGVTKVYRIDLPGKQETVFGVAMKGSGEKDRYMDDGFIMKEIDFKPVRSTAHLPYEILVSGKKVYALYARFRIAINFPDLSMMGDNSFMRIMESPKAIERALILTAGGKLTREHWEE